jgi:pilus assembly protein CpaB
MQTIAVPSVRSVATFAIAGCIGLGAVIVAQSYLKTNATPMVVQESAPAGIPVVAAAVSMDRGQQIQPNLLKVVEFPARNVPAGSFRSIKELTGSGTRLALGPIAADQPLLPANISKPGSKLNLADSLPPGMRAVSVRTNDVVGVGGFVMPGDAVDVLLTRQTGTGNDPAANVTQMVADNVIVLGVDQSSNQGDSKPSVSKTVTVQVSPLQAAAISLGGQVGTLSLALRAVGDHSATKLPIVSVKDLPGTRPAPTKVEPKAMAIRVWRGVSADAAGLPVAGQIAEKSVVHTEAK